MELLPALISTLLVFSTTVVPALIVTPLLTVIFFPAAPADVMLILLVFDVILSQTLIPAPVMIELMLILPFDVMLPTSRVPVAVFALETVTLNALPVPPMMPSTRLRVALIGVPIPLKNVTLPAPLFAEITPFVELPVRVI